MNVIDAIDVDLLLEKVKKNLPTQPGYENVLLIKRVPVQVVEYLLTQLTGREKYIEDFNGADQDWSSSIRINDNHYEVWGSASSGSLNIMYSSLN